MRGRLNIHTTIKSGNRNKYQKKRDKIDRNHIDKIEAVSNMSIAVDVVEQNKLLRLNLVILFFFTFML